MARVRSKRAGTVLKPVRPNAGIQAAYRQALERWVEALHLSLVHWLTAQYRATPPALAQDAPDDGRWGAFREGGAGNALNRQMERLARRWQRKINEAAPKLARWFADKSLGRSDDQLRSILKEGGFTVEFKMTAEARDAYQAVIAENVGLIKSIASEHLTEVQGLVMRSVSTGRDLGFLTKELQKRYAITKRRAALISRDQNNKATAVINRVRQRELGITTAIWKHSHAGKHPRPSHVEFDGKEYDIDKGAYIEGKWIWPGTEINCRCTSQSVIPGFID